MKLGSEVQSFSDRLGHRFKNPELLMRALTHSSISSDTRPDNQRLEFLGDRVLGLVMAEALYLDDEHATEGQLAPRFNALVRKETCADVATEIDLGSALKLGRSEMASGGRRKQTLLGDAMEAVIAAIYLDGGYDAAKDVILRRWGTRIATAEARIDNPKSALQEWSQGNGRGLPTYVERSRSGEDHAPVFEIEVTLEDGTSARAKAASKRTAEQQAARNLIKLLGIQT